MSPEGRVGQGLDALLGRARDLPGEWLLLAPFAGRARLGWQALAWLELRPDLGLHLFAEGRHRLLAGPALEWVETLSRRWGLPAAGFVSHDYGALLQGQPLPAPCDTPLLRFAWYRRWEECPPGALSPARLDHKPGREARLRSLWPRQRWIDGVQEIRRRIRRGEVYQVNLVQPFEGPVSGDGATLFARLLAHSRPAYSACLHLPGRWLLSLSPEQFLRRRGSTLATAPIKGTAPPGHGADLLASAKDRAELAMIVDLLRNDLSRVCQPGTVQVGPFPELLELPSLVHTFARVEGVLRPGQGLQECFQALFPCGSISGCPRLAALEVLRIIEGQGRGPAMGAIGIVEPDGDFDFSVAIRSGWLAGGRLHLKAGGGITWQSRPEDEYAESVQKVKAFEMALE